MLVRYVLGLAIVGLTASVLVGGEFNRVMSLGDTVPEWTELSGVDGKKHSFDDYAEAKCLVVAFTCNSCPYAVDVENRLVALDAKYRDEGVQLIAINVNQGAEDGLEAMAERATEKGFTFPYLTDPSQQIGKKFGATRTPEFFVFDAERRLIYQGSFDDSPDGRGVDKQYVDAAINSVLTDAPLTVRETVPIGCNIRYARNLRQSRQPRSAD